MLDGIRYSFFCLFFVVHLFFLSVFLLSFPFSSLNYRILVISLYWDASAPSTEFLWLRLVSVA